MYVICVVAKKNIFMKCFLGVTESIPLSMGFIPVCEKCHRKCHKDVNLIDLLHKKGQLLFMCNYPELEFIDVFKVNYL